MRKWVQSAVLRSLGLIMWTQDDHCYIEDKKGRIAKLTQADAMELFKEINEKLMDPNNETITISLDRWTIV